VINFFIETSVLMEEFENYHLMPQRPCPIPCSCEAMWNARVYCEDNTMQ